MVPKEPKDSNVSRTLELYIHSFKALSGSCVGCMVVGQTAVYDLYCLLLLIQGLFSLRASVGRDSEPFVYACSRPAPNMTAGLRNRAFSAAKWVRVQYWLCGLKYYIMFAIPGGSRSTFLTYVVFERKRKLSLQHTKKITIFGMSADHTSMLLLQYYTPQSLNVSKKMFLNGFAKICL